MTSALKLVYTINAGEYQAGMEAYYEPIATAATLAVRDAGDMAHRGGQAAIAAGGFGHRWQNTYKVRDYPPLGKVSVNAAAFLYHKIPYAGVFQEGAVIRGKPLLWLPLKSAPKKLGRGHITPAEVSRKLGQKLISINVPGKPPLLAARVRLDPKEAKRVRRKPTISKLLFGTGRPTGVFITVPLFVGITAADIKKKFDTRPSARAAAAKLGTLYYKYFSVRDE